MIFGRLKTRISWAKVPQSIDACFQSEFPVAEIFALGVREDPVSRVATAVARQGATSGMAWGWVRPDNPSWPRPYLLPARLCPKSIDRILEEAVLVAKDEPQAGDLELRLRTGSRYVQNSNFGYAVAEADGEQIGVFFVLWASKRYRLRCWVWYLWQSWFKDLWNFVKWPLALIALLMPPAYYAYRLVEAVFWSNGTAP